MRRSAPSWSRAWGLLRPLAVCALATLVGGGISRQLLFSLNDPVPSLLDAIDRRRYQLLPNTAGCYTADDAVRTWADRVMELSVDGIDAEPWLAGLPESYKEQRTPAEAISKANNTPYGLSAGIWSDKGSKILAVADKLRAELLRRANAGDGASLRLESGAVIVSDKGKATRIDLAVRVAEHAVHAGEEVGDVAVPHHHALRPAR